ncbi:hypothetical protein ACH4UM_19460 [Streptomyces sp. NPDC020801]|uniref:hypothetical protein n=1 Tax=unclassified Streptomyces TaxID=2593676 RepID=UPI0037906B57
MAKRNRIRPGSGATNALFTTDYRPLEDPAHRHEKGAAGIRSAIDMAITASLPPLAQVSIAALGHWHTATKGNGDDDGPMDDTAWSITTALC